MRASRFFIEHCDFEKTSELPSSRPSLMICESAANVFQARLLQKREIHASLSERRIQLQQNFLLVKLSRVFSYQRFLRGDDSVLLLQQISIFLVGDPGKNNRQTALFRHWEHVDKTDDREPANFDKAGILLHSRELRLERRQRRKKVQSIYLKTIPRNFLECACPALLL